MKICGKSLLLLKKIASRFSILFNFLSFFYSAQISDWGLFLVLWGKSAFLDEMKMFPVCFLPKQETDAKEKRLSWSRWKLRRKDVWIRGCVSVPRPTEQRQADIYRRGVMRQRAGQFSAVCDRHVLLVLVRPLNLELKALEEGGCGFLDAFVCIQIITVTNVLFCCFCNF